MSEQAGLFPDDDVYTSAKLTQKQSRWIDEYMIDFNATRAAERAGYSKKTARQIGYETLRLPYIKSIIEKRLKDSNLGAEEAKKIVTDIATANVNDYLKITKYTVRPLIEVPISVAIEKAKTQLAIEDKFLRVGKLTGKAFTVQDQLVRSLRTKLIRLEIEAEFNPSAIREIEGDPEERERVELDVVAIAKDKERGRVKSFKYGKYGPEIELYSADSALTNILRIHGQFNDRMELEGSMGITWNEVKSYDPNEKADSGA